MTHQISRRDLLKGIALVACYPALAAMPGAHAAGLADGIGTGTLGVPEIDQVLRKGLEDPSLAGFVAMGATAKGLVYEGAFGKRNLENGTAMTADTVFWLASMTKAITATACMQLVEQGKLQLDQPMSQILPELAAPMVLEGFEANGAPKLRPAKQAITLRHLLTHTSGYTYSIWSGALSEYEKRTGMPDIGYSKNAAFSAPLEFDPGERFQYGIGMDWVGKIIEAVSDQSLEVYFKENIFTPLGMHDTGFLIGSEQKSRVATMYKRQGDQSLHAEPFEMSQRPEFFMGGGGLFSTPRDYMRFLQMLLNEGSFEGARMLRPETVAAMFQNQIGELQVTPLKTVQPDWSNDANLYPGMPQKWGFSFDINTRALPSGRSAGSQSWAGLLNCYFWLDPVKKVTGSMFTQVLPFYDPAVVKLYSEFDRALYRHLKLA